MNVETEDIKILVAVHPLETTLKHRSQFHSLICSGSLQLANTMIDETRRLSYSDKGSEKLKALVLDCDSLGFSPLHSGVCLLAAESGINRALEATTLLLLSGADVSHCDTYGNTALHWAARSGNSAVLQILAMHGCPLGKQKGSFNKTSYHPTPFRLMNVISCPLNHK
jgi:ankyrin repeat protein